MFEIEPLHGNYSSYSDDAFPIDFGGVNPQQSEFSERLFGDPTWAMTDGSRYIDDRSNTSLWNFDQSKITAGLGDLLNSASQAALQFGVKQAGDSINREANKPGPLSGFFRSFQSTKTGSQLNAGAYAFQVKEFFANPIVWLVAAAGVLLLLLRR